MGLGPDCATQLGVILTRPDRQEAVHRRLQSLVAGKNLAVRTWQEVNPDLAAHVRLDRAANLVFQGLLLLVILFTILNTLFMATLEREREFAVLLALGTPRRLLGWQLMAETFFLGLLGCAGGMVVGGVAAGRCRPGDWT